MVLGECGGSLGVGNCGGAQSLSVPGVGDFRCGETDGV